MDKNENISTFDQRQKEVEEIFKSDKKEVRYIVPTIDKPFDQSITGISSQFGFVTKSGTYPKDMPKTAEAARTIAIRDLRTQRSRLKADCKYYELWTGLTPLQEKQKRRAYEYLRRLEVALVSLGASHVRGRPPGAKNKSTQGRPFIPKNFRRTELIQFNVTQEEKEELEKEALNKGASLAEIVRGRIAQKSPTSLREDFSTKELKWLYKSILLDIPAWFIALVLLKQSGGRTVFTFSRSLFDHFGIDHRAQLRALRDLQEAKMILLKDTGEVEICF